MGKPSWFCHLSGKTHTSNKTNCNAPRSIDTTGCFLVVQTASGSPSLLLSFRLRVLILAVLAWSAAAGPAPDQLQSNEEQHRRAQGKSFDMVFLILAKSEPFLTWAFSESEIFSRYKKQLHQRFTVSSPLIDHAYHWPKRTWTDCKLRGEKRETLVKREQCTRQTVHSTVQQGTVEKWDANNEMQHSSCQSIPSCFK